MKTISLLTLIYTIVTCCVGLLVFKHADPQFKFLMATVFAAPVAALGLMHISVELAFLWLNSYKKKIKATLVAVN